jgi:hypothetical protein
MSVHDFRWLDEAARQGPERVTMKAIDVVPHRWAVWCAVEDGEPFANEIVTRSWSEDGEHIWFMLETHNMIKARHNEDLEVVPYEDRYRTEALLAESDERDRRRMAMRPRPA